jgi:16S rRNA (cytosine1407-C5)-methyltransferase
MNELSGNIKSYLINTFGEDFERRYSAFVQEDHSLYIRFDPNKITKENLTNILSGYEIETEPVKELDFALKIKANADKAGKTIEYGMGKYYIQSLSSMMPPLVLAPTEQDKVLDIAAAPGSKSSQISEIMGNRGTLVANEPHLDRIKMLVHNLDKLNMLNMGVMQRKGEYVDQIYQNYFDKILVDAPCSAIGVLQKKGEVSNWWSEDRMLNITQTQSKIISSAVRALKTGGELVYSTCSLTIEENEIIIDRILKKYPVEAVDFDLPVKYMEAFTEYQGEKLNSSLKYAKRILPWEIDSEGFFIVKLRKTGEIYKDYFTLPEKENLYKFVDSEHKTVRDTIKRISEMFSIDEHVFRNYKYMVKKEDIFFVNSGWEDDNLSYFTRIGTHFCTTDPKGRIRLHTHAAQILGKNANSAVFEADTNQARTFLNGGIIKAPEIRTPQIIKYKGLYLGTALPSESGLKSQYPKSRRMSEITYL